MVALEGTSRLWFVVISASSLLSVLIVSEVSSAAASDGILSYAYDKLLLKDSSPNLQPIKQQSKVMQPLEEQKYNGRSNSPSAESVNSQGPTVSSEGDISWILLDSKGIEYRLVLTKEDYLKNTADMLTDVKHLETRNGSILAVNDYSRYVHSTPQFTELADKVYVNAGNDYQFIHDVWYMGTHSAEYAKEEIEDPSLPFVTLFNGKGDCEDLTILMASILQSSSFTEDWTIEIVYFDAFDPADGDTANHVALFIQTDQFSTFVESTNSELDGLNVWRNVDGWYISTRTL